MADAGNATVFESIGCRNIDIDATGAITGLRVSTNGANIVTPSVDFDNFVLNCGANGGISILSTAYGGIEFGDAGGASRGALKYNHSTDELIFTTGGSTCTILTDEKIILIKEASNKTPTLSSSMSGGIFISGGALWYKGFGGTYTQVAAS